MKKNYLSLSVIIFVAFASCVSFCRVEKAVAHDQEFLLDSISIDLPEEYKDCVDISALIVDLKYDGDSLKVLEFGNIMTSNISGHEDLYGKNVIWKRFWDYLKSFGLGVWCVGPIYKSKWALYISRKKFVELGSRYSPSVQSLKKDCLFKKLLNKEFDYPSPTIEDHRYIILKSYSSLKKAHKKERKKFPGFMFLNEVARRYGNSKGALSRLFKSEYLKNFKPEWHIYPAEYSKKLVEKIKRDFKADTLVIKPVCASRGLGVIVVEKKNLDETLNMILTKEDTIKVVKDPAFRFWTRRKRKRVLIESFEESKHVTKDGKKYDATMRVVFVLCCNKGKINVSFLGSYWKLPGKDLSASCSLTEKHKSLVVQGNHTKDVVTTTPLKVDPIDAKHVQEMLADILPKLYLNMIKNKR